MRLRTVLCLVLCLAALAADPIKEARAFWDNYVKLEHSFDPKAIDLYADDALIQNTRRYPTGKTRVLKLTGAEYKDLLRQTWELAKSRGDTNTYSNLKFKAEKDGRVSITMTRFSNLKKYSSQLTVQLEKRKGQWLIVSEISESQP